jgi:hemerythrin-like domain-containing protein
MATSKKSSSSSSRGGARKKPDIYALLKEDHQKVKKLVQEFEKLHESEGDSEEQMSIAQTICLELKVHAQVEEEVFYPALREAFEEQEQMDLLNEAQVEHDSAKSLIEQIEQCDAEDEMLAAYVKVLGEYVNHHVQEEEKEIFPAARKAKLDAEELAGQAMSRKQELMAEMGEGEMEGEEEEEESMARSGGGRQGRSNGAMRPSAR